MWNIFHKGVGGVLIFFGLPFLYPQDIRAHRPDMTETKIHLFSNGHYRIEIISDIFHFIQKELLVILNVTVY